MSQPTPPPRPNQNPNQLQIELSEEIAQGQYSNLMFVTQSASEFVFDFARALPGARKGRVYARVVMTPQHAKAFQELLARNIDGFEDKHGAIKLPGRDDDPQIGFDPTDDSTDEASSNGK